MTAQPARPIDIGVVSEIMRRRPEPRASAFLNSIADGYPEFAFVTVWRVLDDVRRLDPDLRRRDLADRIQGLVDDLFEDRVIEWSLTDAQAYARTR